MRTAWLLRGGDVLASADVADSFAERARGLLGRASYDGALVLLGTRSAHSAGIRFPIDVAFLDRDMTVRSTTTMRPWTVSLPRRGCAHVLEARAGAFERWRLSPGDRIEIRETT